MYKAQFVPPNSLLVLYFPAYDGIIVCRVIRHRNPELYDFVYGPLPIEFSGYEAGVLPAMNVTDWITFSYTRLPEEYRTDMFYFTELDRLIHAYITVEPSALIRGYLQIPAGYRPFDFRGIITAEPGSATIEPTDFGFFRGTKEMIFLPRVRVQWAFVNRTNMDLRTNVRMKYVEYEIELITDPKIILDVMWDRITPKPYWYSWGGSTRADPLDRLFDVHWSVRPASLIPRYVSEGEALSTIRKSIGGGG